MKYLAWVILLFALMSCGDGEKVQPATVNTTDLTSEKPSQVSYNTSMNFTSAGLLRAILHAGRVQTYDARRVTMLDSNVRVDFYNRDGEHSSVLTSLSAKINQANNNMTAYGQVHVVSDSGIVVDTDSLEWNNREQTLHSESAVKIVEKNGRVTKGTGFQSDQNLSHYTILHPTIEAPANVMQPGAPGQNSLKPAEPVVPGGNGGVFQTPPGTSPFGATDTTKK